MKKFDTNDLTMSSLIISDEIIIEVPVNQRKYSWGLDQVEQYWEDIKKTKDKEDGRHYLGVISLITKEKLSIDLTKYELIDGQQRLITTLLFVAALRDISLSIGDAEIAEKIQKKYLCADTNRKLYPKLSACKIDTYTFDNIVNISLDELRDNLKSIDEHSKTLNKEKQIDLFNRTLKENEEEPISKKIIDAYKYFFKEISNELSITKDVDDKNVLLDMLDILSKIEIIEVISDNISNMFLYFDSLNNRGLHLNSMDIIRNNFFKVISEKFNDKIGEYGELWDTLVLKLDGFECGKFLKYYLMCEQAIICSAKDLPAKYDDLFKEIEEEAVMSKQVRKMMDYAQIYIKIFDKSSDIEYLNKINFLGQQACHSFIMDYFYYVKDSSRRDFILQQIEKMIFRRIICGSSTKQLDGIFREIIKNKKMDEISLSFNFNDKEIEKLIIKNTPDENQFNNAFKTREWGKDNITFYTLYKYEKYVNSDFDISLNKIKAEYEIILVSSDSKKFNSNLGNIILIENDILNNEEASNIHKNGTIISSLYEKTKIQSVQTLLKYKSNFSEYILNRYNDINSSVSYIWSWK